MKSAETATNRSDTAERLHHQLQDSLQELATSEDWQRALDVAACFHDYSFANTRPATRIELANAIFEYLEVFHNRQRRHAALGMRTPIEYEMIHHDNLTAAQTSQAS